MPLDDAAHRAELEALYVRLERSLYNVAYRYVWNAEDARDLVHDAFIRLWNKRASVDWPRAGGLAFRTVLGLASNRRRGNAVRRLFVARELEPAPAAAPDDALLAMQTDRAVRACVDELPEKLRSVLVMCTFSDLEYAQIGAILGIPAGTVGSRRTEAVARVRARLGGHPDA